MYQFPLPLPKHSNMNNVNHLSIKIPPIHEPSLFHVHHQYTGVTTTDDRSESVVATPSLKSMVPTTSSLPSQHQHQHQQQPAVTTPIDTTLQLGLSARLSRLQELIDNCNVLVEERQEKTNQTIDKSAWRNRLIPIIRFAVDTKKVLFDFAEGTESKITLNVIRRALFATRTP